MPKVRAMDEMNETELKSNLGSMTLRDQIRLVHVVIKQVDYDGESGRVTIGIKKRAEHATKDLEEARA